MQSNFFVEHLPVKFFYNELLSAVFYIKKRMKKSLIESHDFESTRDLLIRSSGKISRSRPSEIIVPKFLKHKKDNF